MRWQDMELWRREQWVEYVRAYGVPMYRLVNAASAFLDDQVRAFLEAYFPDRLV